MNPMLLNSSHLTYRGSTFAVVVTPRQGQSRKGIMPRTLAEETEYITLESLPKIPRTTKASGELSGANHILNKPFVNKFMDF